MSHPVDIHVGRRLKQARTRYEREQVSRRAVRTTSSLPSSASIAASRHQRFRFLQVNRDQLAHALLPHGDPKEPIHPRHRHRVVCDD